jgi:hypothetical protein
MGKGIDQSKNAIFVIGIVALAIGTVSIFLGTTSSGFATSDSQLGNLSAGVQTFVTCTWSDSALDVSFGSNLNPGDSDLNATQNYILENGGENGTGYNVSVGDLTTANVNITILGSDLVDGSNLIGIGNVTWASNETANNGTNMIPGSSTSVTGSAVNIASNVAPSSSVHYRFWLDIPSGIVQGSYEGNYTVECAEA